MNDDIKHQIEELAEKAGVTTERMQDFLRTMQAMEAAGNRAVIYTNRAARRARARAERTRR
jgi:hypothetical protein